MQIQTDFDGPKYACNGWMSIDENDQRIPVQQRT